jgi:predicted nucleic-acid-binding protein
VPALCELVWVLSRIYRTRAADIAAVIRRLIDTSNIVVDRPAVEAGLTHLEAGGDFADGVIAFQGALLGSDTFVSFDKTAVRLVEAGGGSARLLS